MKKWFLLLFCGFAIAFVAIPTADAYTVKGAGKCKDWVGGIDDRFWVLGFISGNNYAHDDNVGKSVDASDIYRFISKYCEKNPGDDLADAAVGFINTH